MDFLILNKFSPIIEYFYSLFRPFGEAGFEDLQHSTLGLFDTNKIRGKMLRTWIIFASTFYPFLIVNMKIL
jgi:hypothetical protein